MTEDLEPPVLRIGLCGLGDAGQLHARALLAAQPEDELAWTAIAGRDAAGLARFRSHVKLLPKTKLRLRPSGG
jgi:predicted dehydrogenase